MKMQELMDAMKATLEDIKELDPQEDVTETFKNSKLAELYEDSLSDEEAKGIPNKKAAKKPAPGIDEIAKMMM